MIGELGMLFVRTTLLRGPLEEYSHHASAGTQVDGPFVELWLRVEDGVIQEAAFRTHGCPSSVAASGALCRLIAGRSLQQCLTLTGPELVRVIGGLPEGKRDMADRAVDALRLAARSAGERSAASQVSEGRDYR